MARLSSFALVGVCLPRSAAGWLGLVLIAGAEAACGDAGRSAPKSAAVVVTSAAPSATLAPRGDSSPPPAPNAEPVSPRPGETAPDASRIDWTGRLTAFYSAQRDPVRRHQAYESLFATRLERFIGLKEVSRARAIAAADAFFASKTNVSYRLSGSLKVAAREGGTHITGQVELHFETAVPAAWSERVPELAQETLFTLTTLDVELDADAAGQVTSYLERRAASSRRFRVTTASRGYEIPFVSGCWQAPAESIPSVELPVGTLLEPFDDSLNSVSCGPATVVIHVRLRNRALWVLLVDYYRTQNPAGGTMLGGTHLLEWTE